MLLADVEYARPATVDDALALLAGGDARPLAGGQTLINVLKLRIAGPERLVDVTRIPDLRGVSVDDDGTLDIGAATTYAEIAESQDVWQVRPLVAEVAAIIADVQVRNRGTIGGNVCLNLPTSHFPAVAVALGAELVVVGLDGTRVVPAERFFVSTFTTAVAPGELLLRVRFPLREPGTGDAFVAMAAGKESQSIVHATASLRIGNAVESARIALGCVGAVPIRAESVEQALLGTNAEPDDVHAAVARFAPALSPVSDVNASAEFKRHVAAVLVARSVSVAIERGRAHRGA
jgi:carbon-monoxide dehydrogenase medium subunit